MNKDHVKHRLQKSLIFAIYVFTGFLVEKSYAYPKIAGSWNLD